MDDLTDRLAEVIAETVAQDEAAETEPAVPDEPAEPVVTVTEDDVTDSRGWANVAKGVGAGDRLLGSTDFDQIRQWGGWSSKSFTPEVAEKILMEVADGKSIRQICRMRGMPHRVSVWLWARDCPAFSHALRAAQSMAGDSVVDDMVGLEQAVLDGEVHNRAARVVLESRRWRASKMNARYGDNKRIEVDLESRFMKVTLDGSQRIQQDGKLQDMARLMSERAAKLLPEPGGK